MVCLAVIFYVSGEYNDAVLAYVVDRCLPLLSSFAYDSWQHRAKFIIQRLRITGRKVPHLLDSGAFTTWSKGKQVDLALLCKACNVLLDKTADVCDWTFIALDVIPGKPGQAITRREMEQACHGSAHNYDTMRRQVPGGTILPVFHVGDPPWLAQHYLRAGAQYVALGMSQAISEAQRVVHATANARLFDGCKLHGLAATGTRMLRATPWYSVDSAAWIYSAAMGGIAIMLGDRLWNIAVSDTSPRTKDFDGHYKTLAPAHQEEIARRVAAAGYTVDKLASSYEQRWIWNIEQYRAACAYAAQAPKLTAQEGLFG
jgi:hypothetical protein